MIADAIAASGRNIWLACEAMMYMEDDGCSHSTAADPKCAKNFSAGGPARLAAYRHLLAPGQCNSMTVKLDDVQNHFLPSDPPEADGLDGSVSGTIDFFGDNQDVLAAQVKPGHYNDPEWVLAGTSGQWMPDYRPKNHATSPTSPFVLTPSQTTTQFVLYSLLSVPLLLGLDFRRINQQPQYADLRALLQNPEILAISQDALSEQGRRLRSRPVVNSTLEVWSKNVTNGVAVVLFNHCRTPVCLGTHDVRASMADLGLASWPTASVRDLIHRRDLPWAGTAGISAVLGADGVALFKISHVHRASISQAHKSDDTDGQPPPPCRGCPWMPRAVPSFLV